MPWYDGPDAARAPRDGRDRVGDRNLARPPLPGAVGDPPDVGRAPRLPRLRRAGRRRRLARRRRGRRAALGRRARGSRRSRRFEGALDAAIAPQSVTIRLDGRLDVGRGDMLADPERPPIVASELTADLCWMSEQPLLARRACSASSTRRAPSRAIVDELVSVVDMHTLEDLPRSRSARAQRPRRRQAAAVRAARRRSLRSRIAPPEPSS